MYVMLGMTMVWLILVYIILSVNYRLRRKIIRAEWWNVKEFFYKGKPVRLKFEEIDHTPKTFNMSYNRILEKIMYINENPIASIWIINGLWMKKYTMVLNEEYDTSNLSSLLKTNFKLANKQCTNKYEKEFKSKKSIV